MVRDSSKDVRATPAPEGQPQANSKHSGWSGRRSSHSRVLRLDRGLSARDRAVLASIDQHRFLTTGQLQRLHFHDHATIGAASRICRRVVARLADLRVIEHLERRIGGVRAGSASFVWRVGPLGDQLLQLEHGDQPRARRKEPSLRWLEHCLEAAELHVQLVEAARAGRIELVTVETEPASWRSYLDAAGSRATLKPDLYAVTIPRGPDGPGDFEDHWYLEVDRGTESIPTVLGQCAQYEQYRRTGQDQDRLGVFPRIAWVTTDDRRADRVAAAILASRSLTNDLYRVVTAAEAVNLIAGAKP